MADRSPAFNPPVNSLPADKDSQIVKVAMDKVDWGFRPSQKPNDGMGADQLAVVHVPNGR